MRSYGEIMCYPLPEDILRAKLSGNFDYMRALIDARLESPRVPELLKRRLEYEKTLLPRFIRRYPLNREAALERARGRIRDFSGEELDAFELAGDIDYIYTGGEKRYTTFFPGALLKMHPELAGRKLDRPKDEIDLDAYIREVKKSGRAAYRFRIRSSLKIEPDFFVPGTEYTVHIPIPAACAQQPESEIDVRADADALISAPDAGQRAVRFQRRLDKNAPFEAEFGFTSRHVYVDPMKDAPRVAYPDAKAPCEDDLGQQLPHIAFTPYLRALAEDIAGNETRKLFLARRVYDFVTSQVRYSFMRAYILVDSHAEYAATNLKGDCGIQAVLFITLCRILGVPARWQSGLTVEKDGTGDHDWAQFWTEEFGWLFADPSYGGGAYRNGNMEKRDFYFGNLDPFRMVANRRYMTDFEAPKRFLRFDPFDSQDGEAESETQGFDSDAYDKTDTVLEFEKLL